MIYISFDLKIFVFREMEFFLWLHWLDWHLNSQILFLILDGLCSLWIKNQTNYSYTMRFYCFYHSLYSALYRLYPFGVLIHLFKFFIRWTLIFFVFQYRKINFIDWNAGLEWYWFVTQRCFIDDNCTIRRHECVLVF